jgi:hypothetical protein
VCAPQQNSLSIGSFGSKRESPSLRLMSASTSYGHATASVEDRGVPNPDSCTAATGVHELMLHSMTSSVMASTPGGRVKPSALAVFRLMIKSNLESCTTGRSIGFSPLRMRPA